MAVFVAIPATFYVMWYYAFYGNASKSSLEIALHPKNTLFLFIINVGAIFIYYVVTRLILEQTKTLLLTERNHELTMQTVQYENLQEKITEVRRSQTRCPPPYHTYAGIPEYEKLYCSE